MGEPAEILTCGPVELRRWRLGDLDALDRAILESREHLLPWMPWAADCGREQTAAFLARNQEEWAGGQAFGYAITLEGAVVGSCSLMRRIAEGGLEIGYWVHPRWTRRGLASHAATALVCQGLDLPGVDHFEIHHDAANLASGAVARRLGFVQVARVAAPEGPAAPGEVGVDIIWRLTTDQWHAGTAERG
ncbi:GNAT family N-acetyltransferase [Phaeacidiphilus oryzae]|uniref:GNAT family N-acetyltransferase n=1 Tax=Phaeacidiphilus oryzae TaxID=348818 RepID=UPI00055E1F50|nr:GNAT family N-acetyltransferase [Phaeacidiphilus oryzae]